MDVEDRLTRVTVRVEHGPVSLVRIPVLLRNCGCRSLHRTNQRIVVRAKIVECRDVSARDDQCVERRLGIDVPDCDQLVIFVDESARNLSRDDLAEKAVAHWR